MQELREEEPDVMWVEKPRSVVFGGVID